jgi:uncharacterized protein
MGASCLYEGTVVHHRHQPPRRLFRYRVFMVYLDLDELPQLHTRLAPLLTQRRCALVQMRRADYHGDPTIPLGDAVRTFVHSQAGWRPAHVRLLGNLRTFGHCFNPVSFYYCFDEHEQLQSVLAEVTNTPAGERHAYLLDPNDPTIRVQKRLHVSPFMGTDQQYECHIEPPGLRAYVSVKNHEHGRLVLDATLALARRELTRAALAWMLARYPAHTLTVKARIYRQALGLGLRGAPYHAASNPGSVA